MCGEDGTVISRYDRIAGFDWIGIPLLPYLYAVERAADVPETAEEVVKAQLRETYRSTQLNELIADSVLSVIRSGVSATLWFLKFPVDARAQISGE